MRQPWGFFLKPLPLRGRGGGEGAAPSEVQDRLKHRLDFLQHLIVPESQDKQTLAFEGLRARAVDFLAVLRTIEFDDQLEFVAVEVHDVGRYGMLAAELESAQAPRTQVVPQLVFRIGACNA
jgi:hypothetical protein